MDSETEARDSSSDDELEDTPDFMKNVSPAKTPKSSTWSAAKASPLNLPPEEPNKLDLLLFERKKEKAEEECFKKTRELLLKDILDSSQEEKSQESILSDSLAEEHAEHLEQLELRPSELNHVKPGLRVFSLGKHCCLFDENLTPSQCGFTSSATRIDKRLASLINSEQLQRMLTANLIPMCFHQISQPDIILQWLFFVMSVHSHYSDDCCKTLMQIIHKQKVQAKSKAMSEVKGHVWCPSVLNLLTVFVNLGADGTDLLGEQNLYTSTQISESLKPMNIDSPNSGKTVNGKTTLIKNSLFYIFTVLGDCLSARPNFTQQELNTILEMLAKISLETTLQNSLVDEQHICFQCLLNCYKDSELPEILHEICRRLSGLSSHHHDQIHLLEYLYYKPLLQTRLGYVCLQMQVAPEVSAGSLPSDLMDLKLTDVAWLGSPQQPDSMSTLAKAILDLASGNDLYKVYSIIKLVDFTVGQAANRAKQPKEQLLYLMDQVTLIIKRIRDNLFQQDLSMVKDLLSRQKIKWSFTLSRQRDIQRSIFPWATAETHKTVAAQPLKDCLGPTDIDDIDDL